MTTSPVDVLWERLRETVIPAADFAGLDITRPITITQEDLDG